MRHPYADTHGNLYPDGDSDSNSNSNSNRYGHSNIYTYAYGYSDLQSSFGYAESQQSNRDLRNGERGLHCNCERHPSAYRAMAGEYERWRYFQ